MYIPENVFISYTPKLDNGMLSHGYSGMSISKRWVLAHGSILTPILSRSRKVSELITTLTPGDLTMIGRASEQLVDDLTFRIYRNYLTEESGKVAAIWKCSLLRNTLEGSLENWTFQNQFGFDRLLLPIFLLIKCESLKPISETAKQKNDLNFKRREQQQESEVIDKAKVERVLFRLANQVATNKLTKGAIVELVSTPFGNAFFINSVSRGIIGNLLGIKNSLILMDLSAFPGCEGAPVFLISDRGHRNICGMVVASLTWCRGEWVNCSFAVNLLPSLQLILRSPTLKNDSRYLTCSTFPFTWCNRHEIDTLEKSVTIVKCGPNWGTGILVDKQTGTFITCAHVVRMAPESKIKLAMNITSRKGKFEWFAKANLIYKTPDNEPYDVAVLNIDLKSKANLNQMKAIKLANRPARKGEQVLSMGFPFSSESRPTISSGIVTKTSNYMFQANCCVHSGVSGGPIVRRDNFEMLGIIVCNVASLNGSTLYPRLCIAIPVTVLKEPLNNYLQSADPKTLERLAQRDMNVATTWSFHPFISSNL